MGKKNQEFVDKYTENAMVQGFVDGINGITFDSENDASLFEQSLKKKFSSSLKFYMEERKITKDTTIWQATNIRQSRFSKLKRGDALPTLIEVVKISTFLQVPIDCMLKTNHLKDAITSWEKFTCRDLLKMLIEMNCSKQLNVVLRECFVDSGEYQTTTTPTFEFMFPANDDLDENYIQAKFKEWLRISEPFRNHEHEYDSETLSMLKKGFLSTVDDTKPFYRSNLFGFTDYD